MLKQISVIPQTSMEAKYCQMFH